jgi:hypothetical protein
VYTNDREINCWSPIFNHRGGKLDMVLIDKKIAKEAKEFLGCEIWIEQDDSKERYVVSIAPDNMDMRGQLIHLKALEGKYKDFWNVYVSFDEQMNLLAIDGIAVSWRE